MTEQDAAVLRDFREQVAAGDTERIDVAYRVAGGAPGEGNRVDDVLVVSGSGRVRARSVEGPPGEGASDLGAQRATELFTTLSEHLDALIPRDQARFVPDRQVTMFFVPDEADAAPGAGAPRESPIALGEFEELLRQLLDR